LVWVSGGVSGLQHEGPPEQNALFDEVERLYEAGEIEALVDLQTHIWADGPLQPVGRAPAAVRDRIRPLIHGLETREEPEPKTQPPKLVAAESLDRVTCPALVVVGALDTTGTRASADYLTENLAG